MAEIIVNFFFWNNHLNIIPMPTMRPKRVGSVVMDEIHILSKEFLYKDICEMFEEVMEGNKTE